MYRLFTLTTVLNTLLYVFFLTTFNAEQCFYMRTYYVLRYSLCYILPDRISSLRGFRKPERALCNV